MSSCLYGYLSHNSSVLLDRQLSCLCTKQTVVMGHCAVVTYAKVPVASASLAVQYLLQKQRDQNVALGYQFNILLLC